MSIENLAGAALIIGSVLFIVAAFLPISWVYAERSPENKLARIQASPQAWKLSQVLFGLGATIAALGLALVAFNSTASGNILAGTGSVLAVLGAILWDWHVFLRMKNPIEFVKGSLPGWQFPAYSLLTQFALVGFGISFLQFGYPAWLSWGSIVYPLLLFFGYLAFKDMPPFTYYLLTLVIGIVLIK